MSTPSPVLLILIIHSAIIGCILSLFSVFDTIIYLRILITKKHDWHRFILSLYVPKYPAWKFSVLLEILYLFVISFIFSSMWIYLIYETVSLKIVQIIAVTGFIGTVVLACLVPIQEIIGITHPSVKNIGFPYMGNITEWIIFLWREDSIIGKWYTGLLTAIKYTLWSLPISFFVLPAIIEIYFQ